ncbi:MAG: leucine-rich repeat domain-containing protein [Clostridia bacterium]|nr:leucine-rich repeat domain-containing protein [Clostridia bacterium]
MNKTASRSVLKKLALLLAICVVASFFAACKDEEPEATPVPTAEPTHQAATLSPIYNIEYDPEQFIVSGSKLVEYIGEGGDVVVPNDITVIGASAFAGASKVTSITFPRSVTYIEAYAFEGCTGLTGKFNPPNNLNYIEDFAFKDCTGITEISFENKLYAFGEHIFEGCTGLQKVVLPEKFLDANSTTVLPAYTFSGCTSLTDVTIFKEAASIGDNAFENCTALKEITLPDKLRELGKNVFAGCTSLETINIPKVLYLIGGGSFSDTPWMKAKIEETKNNIAAAETEKKEEAGYITVGQNAIIYFVPENESGDVALNISENAYSLCEGAFDAVIDRLTSITFSSGGRLEFLGDNLFRGAVKLTQITLPSKLKTINDGLFADCVNLETVNVNSKLVSVGNESFMNCTVLKEIYLPDTITSIGDNAFYKCLGLTKIEFPSSIESIGNYAFKDCENISTFIFTLKLSDVGVQAFDNTKWYNDLSVYDEPITENQFHIFGNGVLIKADIVNSDIVIPDNVKSIGAFTFNGWTEIKDREFYGSKLPKSVTIPEGVTRIGDYAFYFCENLDKVFIADSVTEIGEKAFYGCSKIESVKLPATLTEIRDYTFYGCTSLSEVVIPETVTSIGKYAFYNCYSIYELEIPAGVTEVGSFAFTGTPWFQYHNEDLFIIGTTLVKYNGDSEAVLPDTITDIAGGAFENEFTVSVKLPASMTVIPEYAFSGCTALEEIDLSGVTEIAERAFNGCKALEITVDTAAINVAEDAFANCPNVTLK